ncbi:MAG: flavodoxin [Coprococcus sp.]
MKKMLIVYYSWSNGNTKRIAKELQSATGADLARIDTVIPYQGSYDEVVNQGKQEVIRGFEPEIQLLGADMREYDVIAVGTPTWWYTMAPAVRTYLHQCDWVGKTVVPFMTNGGWPGHVIKDMKSACPGADIKEPFEVKFDSSGGNHLETSEDEIKSWVQRVNELL